MDLDQNPLDFYHLFLLQEKPKHPTLKVTAEYQTDFVGFFKSCNVGVGYRVLTLVRSRAPVSARFFSMSLSQWILIFSSMSSRPLPRGTSSSSTWDPASCLYNTFTSLNKNNRHKRRWTGQLNGSFREAQGRALSVPQTLWEELNLVPKGDSTLMI